MILDVACLVPLVMLPSKSILREVRGRARGRAGGDCVNGALEALQELGGSQLGVQGKIYCEALHLLGNAGASG